LDGYWTMAQLDGRHDKLNITIMANNPRSIAIVDDDPSVLKALDRLLGAHSFATRTYLSAPQFLASLPEELPDCLIADLQMPEMTGLELQLALARRGVQIPIIIITAHDEAGMRERCKSAGAIAYLAKPVSDTSLFAAIDSAGNRS
jgi:FixJ family two-component response regulator